MTIKELYDFAVQNNWLDYDICVNNERGETSLAECAYLMPYDLETVVMIDNIIINED